MFYSSSGTAANALHFQMYLLEGLHRWNSDRSLAALDTQLSPLRCYDSKLKSALAELSQSVMGAKLFKEYQPPRKYTGKAVLKKYVEVLPLIPVLRYTLNCKVGPQHKCMLSTLLSEVPWRIHEFFAYE